MSKQTDLINIPDAITVSGSNVGINEQSPDRQIHITDASEVNVKLEAGADTSEIRLKDSDNALTVHLNNNERMGLKSDEVNWTNSTSGFFNKIWGPSSGDIASGFMTYRGSTLRGGFYTNPSHGLTIISEVDIGFRANNANRMHIDTSGRVTMPYQPSFRAYKTSSQTAGSTNETVTWSATYHNVGNHFNTTSGTFTAPVAGLYQFALTCLTPNAANTLNLHITLNGSNNDGLRMRVAVASGHTTGCITGVLNLNASDYIQVRLENQGGEVYGDASKAWTTFSGHLLG